MIKPLRQIAGLALAGLMLWGCGQPLARGPVLPVPATAQAASTGSGKFKLAVYNVRNLFDNPASLPGGPVTQPKPEKEKAALAQVFRNVNPHVVGLVEVESLPTLLNFRDTYISDMGYKHVTLIEGNDQRGIDVAVMSKFPIVNVKSHKDRTFRIPGESQPAKLSRDLLQTTITTPNGYTFTYFVTHLKSKHGGAASDARRKAEAALVRTIVKDFARANPKANYAIAGDFNDTPESPTMAELLGHPQAPKLFDVLSFLAPNDYTYWPQRYRSRIDYMMLSDTMHNEFVPRSPWIHKSKEAFDASDHLPAEIWIDGSSDR